jgi:hypothetical protein
MTDALNNLLTWQFTLGVIVGYAMRHAWCYVHAGWLDKHRPYLDGHPHRRPMVNRTWVGGALALSAVAFSLAQAQSAHDKTVELSTTTLICENKLAAAISADRSLQEQNDALAAVERGLNYDSLKASAAWLALVVTPPQRIFDLHTTDPVYQEWARGVNQDYLGQLMAINQKLQAATAAREGIVAQRAAHPIPPPNCGDPKR